MSSFKFADNFVGGRGYALLDLPCGFKAVIGTVTIPFSSLTGKPAFTPVSGEATFPSAFPVKCMCILAVGADVVANNSGFISASANYDGGDGRTKFSWVYRAPVTLSTGSTFASYIAIGI